MKNTRKGIKSFALVLGLSVACISKAEIKQGPQVMLEEFESVFSTDASLFRSERYFSAYPAETLDYLELPFAMLKVAINQPSLNGVATALKTGQIDRIAVGAKGFHVRPRPDRSLPLGPLRSETAFLIHFAQDKAFNLGEVMDLQPVKRSNGKPVWSVQFEYGGEETYSQTLFVLQPTTDSVLFATTEILLERLYSRLEALAVTNDQSEPLLSSSPYWGVYNYRLVTNPPDGTLRLSDLGGLRSTPSLEKLLFVLNPETGRTEFRYVAATPPPQETRSLFQLEDSGLGYWSRTMMLNRDGNPEEVFRIIWVFGFGPLL